MPSFLPKPPSPVLQRGDPLARGLVGAWTCHEGSGIIHDIVGGRDATFTSGTWAAGAFGSSLQFNGGRATASSNPLGTNTYTQLSLSAWINRPSGANIVVLGSGANDSTATKTFGMYAWSDGRLYVDCCDGANNLEAFCAVGSPDTWHFYAMSYDGSRSGIDRVRVYIDGVQQTLTFFSGTAWPTSYTGFGTFALGGLAGDTSTGRMDNGCLWTRGLASGEIAQLYQDSFRPVRPRPRLWEYAVSAPVVAAIPRIFVDA